MERRLRHLAARVRFFAPVHPAAVHPAAVHPSPVRPSPVHPSPVQRALRVLTRQVRLEPDRRGRALRCPEPRSQWKAPCFPASLPAHRCLSGRTPSAGQPFSPVRQAFAGKLALRQPGPQPSNQRIAAPHAPGKSPASPKSCQKMLRHWMKGILWRALFRQTAPTAPTAQTGPTAPVGSAAKMTGSIHGQALAARTRQGHPQHCLTDLPKQPRQSGRLQ